MVERALTPKQLEALAKVCRTNGGGISTPCYWYGDEVKPSDRVLRALYDKGLIQGKAGGYSTVVHTREGLALYRASLAETAA